MPQQATRTARLEARISSEGLELIRQAAEMEGRSVSDFVVAAAQEAARRTIKDVRVIRIAREDQEAFFKALLDPPEPGPAWHDAIEAHKRLMSPSK
jgi:uncharacterized protein (DUF1778 family)